MVLLEVEVEVHQQQQPFINNAFNKKVYENKSKNHYQKSLDQQNYQVQLEVEQLVEVEVEH